MLIQELIGETSKFGSREINTLKAKCTQFLHESAALPLYKLLPKTYGDFHRVKVRQKHTDDKISEAFNRAFGTQFHNLRQRAIFASGVEPIATDDAEPFYVFPVDGYKFLYSREVTNSNSNYNQVIDALFEQFEDSGKVIEIVTDVLKYTYVRENLAEGIVSDSEIILYGIPCYYAVRVAKVPPYGKLFPK
jgi:hypothetical protein